MLFTGLRYSELNRFKDNPDWFQDGFIHIHSSKPKATIKDKYVRLPKKATTIIDECLKDEYSIPTQQVMNRNLKRWCKKI